MIFLNNHLISAQQAQVSALDRGLLYGDGIFETLRAEQGEVPLFSAHWQRLQRGAELLNLTVPLTANVVQQNIQALLQANNQQQSTVGVRLTLSRGAGQRGLLPLGDETPTLILQSFPLPEYPQAFHARISTIRRNETSPLCHIKSLNYLDNMLAKQQAQQHDAQEAIMLNSQGRVACASCANIFIVKQHAILTPKISEGALPGVTRQRLLDLDVAMTREVAEATITLEELKQAQAVLLCNSLMGVKPLSHLDEQIINKNNTLEIARMLTNLLTSKVNSQRIPSKSCSP